MTWQTVLSVLSSPTAWILILFLGANVAADRIEERSPSGASLAVPPDA